jgi:hypothetical protein
MPQLIYHPLNESANSVSQIDTTIIEMVTSRSIKIACPYLGREPLERIVDQCTDWKLLTDVEELLRSQGLANRDWFVEFLVDNTECVRHCKSLHAKVILAEQQALVGSANFTLRGLTERAEMSVLLSDPKTVDELNEWFDELWSRCSQVNRKAIVDFTKSLPDRSPAEGELGSLSLPPGPQIKTKFMPLKNWEPSRRTTPQDEPMAIKQTGEEYARKILGAEFDKLKPKYRKDIGKMFTQRPSGIPIEFTFGMKRVAVKIVPKAAAILCVLQQLAGTDNDKSLTKPKILDHISRLGFSQFEVHLYCSALAGCGLVKIVPKKGTNYSGVTTAGQAVKLPNAAELKQGMKL